MKIFKESKNHLERKTANGKIFITDKELTIDIVWEKLTEMFVGRGKCIVLNLDRLIQVSEGQIKTGSKFEDYNWAGPRRPLTITTWDPKNKIFSFKIYPPEEIDEKHKKNSWEYQFVVNQKKPNDNVIIDIQLVIEHSKKTNLNAKKTLSLDFNRIHNNLFGYNKAKYDEPINGLSVDPY